MSATGVSEANAPGPRHRDANNTVVRIVFT